MPIPNFDHNHVLPPYVENPVTRENSSPYSCNTLELCQKFSTSKERRKILTGFLDFRAKMTLSGIIHGYQWIGGSFLEDIEKLDNRPPKDMDLITLFHNLTEDDIGKIETSFPEFIYPQMSKNTFQLDHYPFDIAYKPNYTVEYTRYWLQLFSHTRNNLWKGMLKVEINTPDIDQQAMDYLEQVNCSTI